MVELTRAKFERDYANVRPAIRDQHPKSHGCVRAEFVVGPDVPPDLRDGISAGAPHVLGMDPVLVQFRAAAT